MTGTRRTAKQAERERFTAHVKAVLEEAHKAAAAAATSFMATAKRSPDGHIIDACGGAHMIVYKPSYRLRTALKELGEIERGYKGAWHISQFWKHAPTQSITAHEVACRAARDVFANAFPSEGEFFAPSYMT